MTTPLTFDPARRAERALAAAAYPFAAAVEPLGAKLADVRRAMPRDSALVLFVPVQPRVASDFAKPEVEQREPDLYALLLPSADAAVRAVKLGSLGEATQRIESWTDSAPLFFGRGERRPFGARRFAGVDVIVAHVILQAMPGANAMPREGCANSHCSPERVARSCPTRGGGASPRRE